MSLLVGNAFMTDGSCGYVGIVPGGSRVNAWVMRFS